MGWAVARTATAEFSAAAIGLLPPRHGRGGRRAVARQDPRIDHRNAAAFDHGDRLLERLLELGGVIARTKALGALAARDGRHVDVGIADALPDPFVIDRTVARDRDTLLVD